MIIIIKHDSLHLLRAYTQSLGSLDAKGLGISEFRPPCETSLKLWNKKHKCLWNSGTSPKPCSVPQPMTLNPKPLNPSTPRTACHCPLACPSSAEGPGASIPLPAVPLQVFRALGFQGLPIGPKAVPFRGSYLEFYKVIPKRNYFGAYG